MHSKVIVERARLREVAWGDARQVAAVLNDNPGGFDVLVGADVVYVQEFVAPLLDTARRMLRRSPQVGFLFVARAFSWFALGGCTRKSADQM